VKRFVVETVQPRQNENSLKDQQNKELRKSAWGYPHAYGKKLHLFVAIVTGGACFLLQGAFRR
jgi:hypothetical protein